MSLKIRFLLEARAEFDAATDWYEEKQAGLGVDFVSQLHHTLARISTQPRLYPIVYENIRKAVLKRFPYVILYREEAGAVTVIAIFHSTRNPNVWKLRV